MRDKSKVRCFNYSAYIHDAAECKKPKRNKEAKVKAHIAQISDDEPSLLMLEKFETKNASMLINETQVMPKLNQDGEETQLESNLWYLDNGANNHMTGQYSKFD